MTPMSGAELAAWYFVLMPNFLILMLIPVMSLGHSEIMSLAVPT